MAPAPRRPSTRAPASARGPLLGRAPGAEAWLDLAADAVARAAAAAPDVEPLKGALVRAAAALGRPADPRALLRHWQSRTPGTAQSDARYRWELSHRIGAPVPAYAGPPPSWRAWRPGDQARLERDPFDFELSLLLPVVLSENAELLIELAAPGGEGAPVAHELLGEAAPILRRDFARYVQMASPWDDTFALWCLARRPNALSLLHPLAVAIAACYAATTEGPVRGARFPYHDRPLASASAHLAGALLTLGSDLELAARLADFVRDARRASGGWGDAAEPDDPLTTLVCADLLARVDPTFDPRPTLAFLRSAQAPDGLWRALGPDAPWLTLEVLAWAEGARRPFAERFRWPHRAEAMRDHKTGLPFFAYFSDLAELFAALGGLADAPTELAFIDLIGFRAFNNRFGQTAGDDVLREFAAELAGIAEACAIRDGGDEFVVVAAPTRAGLARTMDSFRRAWPVRFRAVFGDDVPPVAPRVLVARTRGRGLRRAREELGRGITGLKNDPSAHPLEGILVDAGDL
ncbi:MAG TPA: GGDEF domain-containing protein [Polyangiaceae bacterium]|nr:GGDEF domain-containing protein [Polyangiaceae bacterium]